MRKTTPVCWRNRKPAYPCAIQLKSQSDLQHKYPKGNQQVLFFASFAINSLLPRKKPFGDRFRRTASTTKESAQIDVISSAVEQHDISATCGRGSRSAKSIPPSLRPIEGA
jgi:hypothetical protein